MIAGLAWGQLPLSPSAQADSPRLLDEDGKRGGLECHVEPRKPFLDYSFRFEIGYIVRCGLAQFQGKETKLRVLLRITPLHRAKTVFEQDFVVPGMLNSVRKQVNIKHLRAEIQFSGVYAAGEGVYENELVIADDRDRFCRKTWRARTAGWAVGEDSPMALKPLQVESISLPPWGGRSSDGTGLRLTVLLDAAPVAPNSATLRAWDRAFLLGAVSSVLRHVSISSVRLIAFNLDQQREIFREEDFDASGMSRLAEALAELELGTIAYKTLQQDRGWAELLDRLVREETSRSHPVDAVIFVGPAQHFRTTAETETIAAIQAATPFFYFEYSPHLGSEFPDAIERVTHASHGITFRLHSPEDLAQALSKMEKVLRTRP